MNKVSVCLLLLLGLGLVGNFMPQAKATFTSSNWIEEITTLPSNSLNFVNVDSQGRIYVGDDAGGIWKSLDRGVTWTQIYLSATGITGIYVDNRDYLYVQNATAHPVYRTVNQGSTWQFVFAPATTILDWEWDTDSTGRIYAANYENAAPTKALIFRSNTDGLSFSVWLNLTGETWHLHDVAVAPNDWIYVSTGDVHRGVTYGSIRRWNGTAWEIIVQSTLEDEIHSQSYTQPVAIWFMDDKVYFGQDTSNYVIRMPITGSWSQKEDVLYLPAAEIDDARVINGIGFFGNMGGELFATWDGERYVKLFKSSDQAIRDLSEQETFPLYFTTITNGKVFRINYMTKEDLAYIFYTLYNSKRGLRTNQDNYVLEQRMSNGTNYLDLTTVALSNVQASIKGLTKRHNLFTNTGFETGTTTGWTAWGATTKLSVVTNDKYEGTYSLQANVTTSSVGIYQDITIYPNEYVLISFAAKSGASKSGAWEYYLANQTAGGTTIGFSAFVSTTNWTVRSIAIGTSSLTSWTGRITFIFKGVTLLTYFDAVIIRAPEVGYIKVSSTEDSISFGQGFNSTYSLSGTTNTLNPTLTIDGQSVSYSGTLTNGTESTPQSLTGILTGAVAVSANIQGSGQAILRIIGTRLFTTTNVILKGLENGWYYGHYYKTPIYPTELYALTNLQADITSLSYSSSKLTFTVSASSGTTSITKVYVGDKGKPTSVSGATSWSYDATTKTLIIIIIHSSSQTVILEWLIFSTGIKTLLGLVPFIWVTSIFVSFTVSMFTLVKKKKDKKIILEAIGIIIVTITFLALTSTLVNLIQSMV